ncbi:sodium:solute symporter family protein [uncultured Microscilla sp.]|uniref:sodium:solute symporter family protein n=1 Tax=uncultured Microscilla sp. TaxID=432653 RepID=UPI0026239C88|nr:sodium:solute symporter family protein [uncultured Microscilla sp.]
MILDQIDWAIIVAFFVVTLAIGMWVSRKAGSSAAEFFLSGRNMPWWLLGVSMVATTFSADTPNLVTDIVRQNGVSGNWVWWAFLLTGMLTVFVYAKLWRRSKVMTDLEFYEQRYSGKAAAFLRGFRAIYLGVFFNIMIMAAVSLAAIKIGGVMLGLTPVQTLLIASVVTVAYSSLGGLRGVIITDFVQFAIAMIGAVWAAYVVLSMPEVGGLDQLLAHENVKGKLNVLPDFSDMNVLIPVLILPLAVQWWSVWYPGAEPGGGGYIAQRMLSAKSEKHAMGATLFFNLAHYALRPWPWIIIALASLVVFPMSIDNDQKMKVSPLAVKMLDKEVQAKDVDFLINRIAVKQRKAQKANNKNAKSYAQLGQYVAAHRNDLKVKSLAYLNKVDYSTNKENSDPLKFNSLVALQLKFPHVPIDKLGQDLSYSGMLTFLPVGLLGLVIASLIAAFMSTISTHLNWGSSYIVNDFYKRFVKPEAKDKELVTVGRVSTVVLMVFAAVFALLLENALQAFNILLQIGAGTGLIFILRWFWWRINAYTEIVAMFFSFFLAIYFQIIHTALGFAPIPSHIQLVLGVALTTVAWVVTTLITRPTDAKTLQSFYLLTTPGGPGWKKVRQQTKGAEVTLDSSSNDWQLPLEILGMVVGCFTVYSALFATGFWLYNQTTPALVLTLVAIAGGVGLFKIWGKLKTR